MPVKKLRRPMLDLRDETDENQSILIQGFPDGPLLSAHADNADDGGRTIPVCLTPRQAVELAIFLLNQYGVGKGA